MAKPSKVCIASTCPRAGKSQPLTAFTKDKRRPDGLASKCRSCTQAHVARMRAAGKSLTSKEPKAKPSLETPVFDRPISGQRFIITAAQNNTEVRADFLAALKTAAAYLQAEIIVVPYRYKNPTGHAPGADLRDGDEDPELWWADELDGLLLNTRQHLSKHLVLAADVKIQPTASSPLSGFESLTGAESCIIGHPKLQLRTVPVPSGRVPKILTTTGVVTEKNYSNTKAGALGEFHYSLGATLVEVDSEGFFHLRQLLGNREDGSFTDLDLHYTGLGITKAPPALGLVMGDTHARFIDPQVEAATFGPGGIVAVLQPKVLVWHDLLDGYAANPHHKGKPFIAIAKMLAEMGSVAHEVSFTVRKLVEWSRGRQSVIVRSNHDEFLERWIESTDWRNDPLNAVFYLKTALHMAESVRMGDGGSEVADPFAFWVRELTGSNPDLRCLASDESFELGNISCGMHGQHGPNGSRGTVKNLSRLGTRAITGHGHSPAIEEGHWRVGTSTRLRLEYNRGPSSWLNTHCVVYASGKRALITIIDGRWRTI